MLRVKKSGIIFQNSNDQIIVTSIYKKTFTFCFFNGFFRGFFQWIFQCFFQWFFQCSFSMDFSVFFSMVFPVFFHLIFQWFYFIRSTLKGTTFSTLQCFSTCFFNGSISYTFHVKRYNFVNTPKKYCKAREKNERLHAFIK